MFTPSHEQQLVAVAKTLQVREAKLCGNQLQLLTFKDVVNILTSVGSEPMVIQKFIRSKGNRATLLRTKYEQGKSCCTYSITNRQCYDEEYVCSLVTDLRKDNSTFVQKSWTGRHVKVTGEYLKTVCEYLGREQGVEVASIVGDFIRDEMDQYWLLGVKGLKVKRDNG